MTEIDEIMSLAAQPPKEAAPSSVEDEIVQLASEPEKKEQEISFGQKLKAHANAAYLGALDLAKGMERVGKTMGRFAPHTMVPAELLKRYPGATGIESQFKAAEARLEGSRQSGIGGLDISRLAGNIAATLPIPFSGFSKLAQIPKLLPRLGAYAAKGAAQGATLGALAPEENADPNVPFNVQGATVGAVAGAPLGMLSGGATRYFQQAKALGKLQKTAPGAIVLNRDLTPEDRVMSDLWDAVPLVGGRSLRERQAASFPGAVETIIKDLSKEVGKSKSFADASGHLENVFTKAYTRLKDHEATVWANAISKDPIKVNLMDTKVAAKKFYTEFAETGIPYKLARILKQPVKSLEDLKEMRTAVRHQQDAVFKKLQNGSADRGDYQNIKAVYDSLTNKLEQGAISQGKGDAFTRANAYTKELNEMFVEGGSALKAAIKDNAKAYNFFQKMLTEKNPEQVRRMMKPFKQSELMDIRAGLLRKHLDSSVSETGKFNVSNFVEKVGSDSNADIIMGDSYKAIKGLKHIMESNLKAYEAGTNKRLALGAALGGVVSGGAVLGSPVTTAAVMVSARGLTELAGLSPLKRGLVRLGNMKSINNDVGQALLKQTNDAIRKAGYVQTGNELRHTSEENE